MLAVALAFAEVGRVIEIAEKDALVRTWKDAWFQQRDATGKYGYGEYVAEQKLHTFREKIAAVCAESSVLSSLHVAMMRDILESFLTEKEITEGYTAAGEKARADRLARELDKLVDKAFAPGFFSGLMRQMADLELRAERAEAADRATAELLARTHAAHVKALAERESRGVKVCPTCGYDHHAPESEIPVKALTTEDGEITCIACGDPNCEREIWLYIDTKGGTHKRVAVGLHDRCGVSVVKHEDRVSSGEPLSCTSCGAFGIRFGMGPNCLECGREKRDPREGGSV